MLFARAHEVIERQARIPIGHAGRLWVEVRSGSRAAVAGRLMAQPVYPQLRK
jgi:hypothetical protein